MSPERVVMIGAGGHARVLRESLALAGVQVDAFIAPEPQPALAGAEWLGDDGALSGLDPASVLLVNGVGSAGDATARMRVWDLGKAAGFTFATVVDPTAVVRPSATLAEGAQVLMGAIVGTGVRVGENAIINSGAVVDHDCVLGAHVHVSPGVALAGGVSVGLAGHVGLGARVIQGVSIGSHSVVGAGAVVLGDVPDGQRAVGVPATSVPRA